jgi:hypothetical protein
MPNCGLCGRSIPEKEMQGGALADILGGAMPGMDWRKMPNTMDGLAMKCNRCGAWLCSNCASKTAMRAGAGMIQHSGCGGVFETP